MKNVKCPYCGHKNEMGDYFESNEFDHTCWECGEEFEVYVEYEPSLSASKIEYILCPICGEIKRTEYHRYNYNFPCSHSFRVRCSPQCTISKMEFGYK